MRAFAQVDIGNWFLPENSPFREGTFGALISAVLPWVFMAAMVTVFAFLLWGGLQFIFSGGDPKQKSAAQKRMTFAVLGLVIIIAAFIVIQLVEVWTGITIFGGPQAQCPVSTCRPTLERDCPIPPCRSWTPRAPGARYGDCCP